MDINDLRDLILEHFMDENGDVDISGLDFSNFNSDINIGGIRTNGDLWQSEHRIGGNLWQSDHNVGGNLWQDCHNIAGKCWQDSHIIGGDLIQGNQKVKGITRNYMGFENRKGRN